MELEVIKLEHVPDSYTVHLALFRDVKNAAFLHQQLLARNSDFEYAFVDASVVVSRMQLLAAVFKATNAAANGALQTPNIHSETVASLSPSNNIADAYRRFGISPTTKDLLVVKITFPTEARPQPAPTESIAKHLQENVEGISVPASDDNIAACADMAKVRKYYKLNGINWLNTPDQAEGKKQIEGLILGSMALRGV
ncbi:Kinase binding protein CGI-121 [Cordyceps fumosorosea ARSEF 2679]|uniref:EKC/KEOPS complex subunit CGI121 n=1 Tax=Cordyceps fumosorosea (strain ARSEF 2679) TaxID=1081104 RepID=A0A168ASS1_CORFA|nr:Kinase binding protein CGI-121 [Cordyceps fumosorosea ARSEF 2679]OAA69145.1 Kinase binding protein CGI-121 [Cordyceps fumosorosea ARSEF 2679]